MTRLLLGTLLIALAPAAAAQVVPNAVPSDAVTREAALDYAHASGRYAGLLHVCGAPLEQSAYQATAMEQVALLDPSVTAQARKSFEAGAAEMVQADCSDLTALLQRIRDDMAAVQARWFDHVVGDAPKLTVGWAD